MKEKEPAGGLWESILNDVHKEGRVPDKTLLLMGRPGIGKRTLMHALLSHACPSAASAEAETSPDGHSRAVALDYAYFGGRDPAEDEAASAHDFVCPAAVSVQIMEDPKHEKLLRSRLSPEGLQHYVGVICLDLKAPWTMMEDLRQWLQLLQNVTSELLQQLPLQEQDELRGKATKTVSEFVEVGASAQASPSALLYNMGIPVIVVVSRADGASSLETQRTVGWSEFIEASLRNECLPYGAALVYTMVQAKNTTNVDVLYDYLMHRLYEYPLKHKAKVPSRDALFVPSGWDTQTKVDTAASQLPQGGLDHSFESVVVSMEAPATPAPAPVVCEDMQHFLKFNAGVLQKLGGGSAARKTVTQVDPAADAMTHGSDGGKIGMDASQRTRIGSGKLDNMPGGAPKDNAQLEKFFKDLLKRGQGSTSSVPGAAPGAPAAVPGAAGAAPMGATLSSGASGVMVPTPSGNGAAPQAAPPAS